MNRKSLVSPAGRVNKNDVSSSPLDRTVAETPSPGGPNTFSPDSVHVKASPNNVDESPIKPFDEASPDGKSEVQRDFESIWNADNDKKVDAPDRMDKKTVNITGKKSSFHVRYLNQVMNGESSPESVRVPTKGKARVTAPVPFLATGSPIQNTESAIEGESPLAQRGNSFSPSLSDEIALAQKLGMAESLASVPESAQRTLMMHSVTPPSTVDVAHCVGSPLSPMSMPAYHATEGNDAVSPADDVNPIRPHYLFQSSEKDENNRSFDQIDQILARDISNAAEESSIQNDLFKSKAVRRSFKKGGNPKYELGAITPPEQWKGSDSDKQSDTELPFDCTVENMSSMNESRQFQCLDERKSAGKLKRMSVRKILRSKNGSIAGITVKKELKSSSDLTPNKVREAMRSLRDYSIHPSETHSSVWKSKGEKFDDETFAPLTFNAVDKSYDPSDPSRYTIQSGSPPEGGTGSSSDKKERRRGTQTAIYICILVALMIIGVLAGLVAGGKLSFWSKEESNVAISNDSDEIPIEFTVTSTATFTPTEIINESNIFEGSEIIACENAVPLTEMNQAYYGSNWKAFWDASIDTCGDQMSTGYAVWYSFTTNSSTLVEASTCNNADFDTQITVMSGSCSETNCISYNDQGCGDQSLVTWYAEANTTYYIMVHGFREASGTFGLTLSEAFQNDQCTSAVKLEDETVVAGTTAGTTSLTKPPECGDVDFSGDGVWYEIDNVSGFYKAELMLGYTDFSGQVAIYRSIDNADLGCDALICDKGSSTGSVMWLAEATETYYVYVTGKNETAGDFDLFLGRNKDASCNFGTRLDPNSVGFLASTKFENPRNVESCGYTGYHTAPGLWFSVMGTGTMLEVSTCGSLLDLDTQISVFGSACDSLECIGGTGQDTPCGDNGSVSWQTEKDEVYNIYVSGRSSRVGDFVLNINEVPVADGFTCDGSLPLELGSTTIQSNTTAAPSESVDLCTGSSAVRGVWHQFIGTGMTMKISVCNDETDFDARVSLFTGSCNGLSCVAYTQSRCGDNDEILITTHVGMTYHLFVHGPDSVSIGNYLLTIEETEINDSCAMSSSLELAASPQYFGSTLSAGNSTALGCSGDPSSESGALWYTFVGTGEVVTLSTCSAQTDFNSDIRVYSGSCSQFECVSDVSATSCEDQSMLSFQSVVDEVYYTRIGGINTSDSGNFVLEVNPGSRFFLP
jgi:hypothetical protein